MRHALVLATCLALLAPIGAAAGPKSRDTTCDWIERMLENGAAMKARAAQDDDQDGVERVQGQIDRLQDYYEKQCPVQAAQRRAAAEFALLLKTAASAALSYLTLGAY